MLLNIQIFFLSLPLAIAFAMIPSPTSIAPKRGAFIVLEGVDRCGKTTQCGLLLKHLLSLGLSANAIRFPDRTTSVGTLINSYLQSSQNLDDRAIHLLFSANRWEAVPTLKENLAAGTTLICDRYAHSGVAFSSAKESDLTVDWCKGPDIGLPSPDAVIFLNLSQDEAEQRGGYGGERYEKRDLQLRVRQRFNELQEADDGKIPWHMIDAAQSMEAVTEDIVKAVNKVLEDVSQGKPLQKLWSDGVIELSGEKGDDVAA